VKLPKIEIKEKEIEAVARKWRIRELSLFGSVLSEQFSENSDIDVLIQFDKEADYSLFDLVDLKEDLEKTLGRTVDLVEKAGIKNPYRKEEIFNTAKVIYAAR
jgi:predicted nucleotidyltransferase